MLTCLSLELFMVWRINQKLEGCINEFIEISIYERPYFGTVDIMQIPSFFAEVALKETISHFLLCLAMQKINSFLAYTLLLIRLVKLTILGIIHWNKVILSFTPPPTCLKKKKTFVFWYHITSYPFPLFRAEIVLKTWGN